MADLAEDVWPRLGDAAAPVPAIREALVAMRAAARRPDGEPEAAGLLAPELRTRLEQAAATVPAQIQGGGKSRERSPFGAALAAALLHLVLAAVVVLSVRPAAFDLPTEGSIEIELVDPIPSEAAPPEPTLPIPAPAVLPPAVPPSTVPAAPAPDLKAAPAAMMHATRILTGRELADPRNRQARKELAGLAADGRLEQLCDMEAMAQLHAWKRDFRPDMLVAYAMADTRLAGTTLHADGGAFRSRQDWYAIAFDCEVSPDLTAVKSFAFRVGGEIPKRDWRKHDLTLDDAD